MKPSARLARNIFTEAIDRAELATDRAEGLLQTGQEGYKRQGKRADLEEGENVRVGQAVLVAAEVVGHLAEALLTNAQLPQAERYVSPLLVILHIITLPPSDRFHTSTAAMHSVDNFRASTATTRSVSTGTAFPTAIPHGLACRESGLLV